MAYGGILNGTDREPDTCASSNFGSRRMITLTGSYGNISTFISFFLSFLCIFNARNNTTHGVYRFDNLMQVYIFCCSCQQLRSIDRQLLMQWIGKAKSKPCWMRKRKHWMRIKQRIGEAGAHRVVTAAIVFFYRFISSRVDWNGRHRAVLRWGSKKQTSVFFSSVFPLDPTSSCFHRLIFVPFPFALFPTPDPDFLQNSTPSSSPDFQQLTPGPLTRIATQKSHSLLPWTSSRCHGWELSIQLL